MNYSEILDTQGRYRARLVLDEDAGERYDDGASPLLRIDSGARATHVMATGRPLDADETVEQAISYWHTTPGDSNWRLIERYLRAFHGVTQIETWHSGSYWYVTYDSAAWREYAGAPPGSADMSEYRAWCEGDVWGWVVEKLVLWTTADAAVSPAFKDEWEHVNSCWGYYGNGEYLKQCAREALAYEAEHGDDLPHEPAAPGTGDDTLTPERIAAAVADMQRVQRNLDADRNKEG
jgi:hypothetical protein